MAEGDTIPRAQHRLTDALLDQRLVAGIGSIIQERGQGDANRTTWWCERCQT